jgi:GT2 family glycosyltransferase
VNPPSVTAVVPAYNRSDLLGKLLVSARSQHLPFREIIVVDNGSEDAARDVARSFNCSVIEMGTNAGFAAAVNRGWRAASSEWVAILNSDVELAPHWTERLLLEIGGRAPDLYGFATGSILNAGARNCIDGTYDLLSRAGCAWRAGYGETVPELPMSSFPIAVAPATALLFRTQALARLNGFDEHFESYLEDVDLGLRALRLGIRGMFVPDAVAWHHGSASLGRWHPKVVRLTSRNQLLLIYRHYDAALFRSCLWPIVAGQLLWGLVAARHGALGPWLKGKLEALRSFRIEGADCPALRAFLAESEREIRRRARNPYWRWYFRITRTAAH